METLLEELNTQPFDSPDWGPNFERLVQLIEHHTSEEENEFFPKAHNVLGKDSTEAIQQRYLVKKQTLME